MEQKFYIRQNNIILGPFTRQTVITMLNSGKLSMQDAISSDKLNWQTPQTALDLLIPEAETTPDDSAPEPPVVQITVTAPEKVIDLDDCIELAKEDFSQKLKFCDMLLTVLASLGNGGGYLHRLSQYSGNAILVSGIAAAFFGLIFAALGALLFGGCYNVSMTTFCVHCLMSILLSGTLFWGGNTLLRKIVNPAKTANAAEADFSTGMLGMMNMSVIGIILNGSLFVFNKVLFNMSMELIAAVMTAALLPLLFFSVNVILLLRMNFMVSSKLSPGMASLWAVLSFYAATVLSVILLYTIYHFA